MNKIYKRKLIALLPTVFLLSLISACEKEKEVRDTSVVLVTVNGDAIYEKELEINMISMFGPEQSTRLGKKEKKKILESMVMSKLIRQQAEKSFTKEKLGQISAQANIYKEKLLVNQYLKEEVNYAAVTDSMVADYYDTHLDEFGYKSIKQYELLTTDNEMSPTERDKFLKDFSGIDNKAGLAIVHEVLKSKGHKAVMLKGVLKKDVLDKRIYKLVNSLDAGTKSNITFVNRKPYLAHVLSAEEYKAKSLEDVSDKIRAKLKPVNLKKSITDKTNELKAKAEIIYLEQGS